MQDECVLCCIKIDANGAIVMKPDFSETSYLVQTGGFAKGTPTTIAYQIRLRLWKKDLYVYMLIKETYEYYLEHFSSKITQDDLMREVRLHKELYVRHSDYIKNLVGEEFKYVNILLNFG